MAELAFQRLHKPKEKDRRAALVRAEAQQERPGTELTENTALELTEQITRSPDAGDPLSPLLRADLEQKFRRDLSQIRIHTSPDANRASTADGGIALTRGAHIFLASPAIASNKHVLAHELTHVVQQGAAPPVRFAARSQATMPRAVPLAIHSPADGQAISPNARAGVGAPAHAGMAAPTSATAGPAAPAQALDLWGTARSVGGSIASGIRSTAGAVIDAGTDLLSMGRDALMGVVRRIAPDFLPMFEGDGVSGFLRKLIQRGFSSLFDGLLEPLKGIIDVDSLSRNFQSASEWVSQIADQLGKNDCSGILAAASKVRAVFNETLQPVIDRVKSISKDVEGFFHDIWQSIGLPIMDVLKRIGGEIWDSLRGFVGDLAALIGRVRDALGGAWQTVKGWLGISAEDGAGEGGGLWNWVRDKATSIGNSISETIKPALDPLRRIGGVMLLIVPGGQLAGILLLWPEIKQGFEWISKQWDDLNLIPRAREEIANVIIPKLLDGAEQFGQALISGADWLLERLDEFHQALGSAAEAAVGFLAPLRRLIDAARAISHRLITWAREKLQYLSRNLRSIMNQVIAFMGKVADALQDLIAAVVNPFGIIGFLAGHLWLALPECLKGPIIDFLLDVIDGFIAALPDNPLLGLLWPVMKAALTGFMRKVRNVKLQEKIDLADKIARIISGQSFEFAIGFLKGIVIGIWEEITSPFRALAAIFDLPEKIQKFLDNLGVSLCEIVEQIRCFLATLAQSVFGRLDELLGTLQEYLENPSKIIDLLTCAAKSALSAAETLGETVAEEMIKIFRESDEKLGERLGKFTGGLIVQAVISYFTAGAGAGASIAAKIADMLGTVGKAIAEVVKFITEQVGKLIKFIKNLISSIGSAIVKTAKGIFGRMKGFFGKVFAWFKRLFGRFFKWWRKKFALTLEEREQWQACKLLLREALLAHPSGITKRDLRVLFRQKLQQFKKVAKWPAYITKHGPNWVLHVRRVKSILPRKVGEVRLDAATRLKAGTREAKKQVKLLKATHRNIGADDLLPVLERVRERFHLTTLSPRYQPEEQSFEIHGAVNPSNKWRVYPNRPDANKVTENTAHRSITIDPLTKLQIYSPPTLLPWSPWDEVSVIRSHPSGTRSLYVKGHIGHGRFVDGYAKNLMPITVSANKLMSGRIESDVIGELRRSLKKRPVFKYEVSTASPSADTLRKRQVPKAGGGVTCKKVDEEKRLVHSINVTATSYSYSAVTKKWDVAKKTRTGRIPNVPPYPRGYGEPCS